MRSFLFGLVTIVMASATPAAFAATAPTPQLSPELSGVGFLVGSWANGAGSVADTGGTSRGSSSITPEAGGSVLLRRDHTDLFDGSGKPTGSFDQIMMIYPEGGTLRADYSDGTHVIHYTSATVTPGHTVTFETNVQATSPAFRLTYDTTDEKTLTVKFESAAPGQTVFHTIASGTLQRR